MLDRPIPGGHDDAGALDERLARHADVGLNPTAQARIEGAVGRRLSTAASRRWRLRTWIASHVLLVGAAGVVSVGGAGAAAVVIQQQSGTPSHATKGEVPRAPGNTRKRDLKYELTMSPDAEVGGVGWCSSLALYYERRPFGGGGCGAAPLTTRHVFGGGTTYLGKGNGLIAYSVVDRTVAYALTTARPPKRILPVDGATLPNGWRAIIQLPGESHTGNLRYRDAAGRPVRTAVRGGQFAERQLPTGASAASVAADAPCGIELPSTASARGSRWLTKLVPTPNLAGRALLPCAQTRFRMDDAWAEATVFVDASRPAADAPMPMPAIAKRGTDVDLRMLGAPYAFEPAGRERMPMGRLMMASPTTARRIGNAWLTIRTDDRALRDRLLDEVRIEVRAP